MLGALLQDSFDGFCLFFQKISAQILVIIINELQYSKFTPSLDAFKSKIFVSEANVDVIMNFFSSAGVVIAIGIFCASLILLWFSGIQESRDTVKTLIIRLVICIALMMGGKEALQVVLDAGNEVLTDATESLGSGEDWGANGGNLEKRGLFNDGENYNSWIDGVKENWEENEDTTDVITDIASLPVDLFTDLTASTLKVMFAPMIMIIRIILYFIIAYNFVKLVVELIQRYVSMCMLYVCFPTACGLMVSSATSSCFMAYIRMFAVSVFTLVYTRVWIILSLFLIQNMAMSMTNSLIILAFIRLGTKLEMTLRNLGLTTSMAGGALLDELATTGLAIGMGFNAIRQGGGKILMNGGAMAGNANVSKLGSVLMGKGVDNSSVASGMKASMGGQFRENFNNGDLNNLTGSTRKMMDDLLLKNGAIKDKGAMVNMFKGLNAGGQKDYLDHLTRKLNGGSLPTQLGNNQSLKSVGIDDRGNIKGEITSPLGKRTCTIENAPKGADAIGFTTDDGKQMYANFDIGGAKLTDTDGAVKETLSDERSSFDDTPNNMFATMSGLDNDTLRSCVGMEDGTLEIDDNLANYEAKVMDGNFQLYHIDTDGQSRISLEKTKEGKVYYSGIPLENTKGQLNQFQSYFSGDGAFANLGYNNVRNVQYHPQTGGYTFTYDDAVETPRDAIAVKYLDHRESIPQNTKVYGDRITGSYAFATVKDKTSETEKKYKKKR